MLERFDKPLDAEIAITADGRPFAATPRDFGAAVDALEQLRQTADRQNGIPLWQRVWLRITGRSLDRHPPVVTRVDMNKIEAFVDSLARAVD